jgi:Effector Associated Constant Component 1
MSGLEYVTLSVLMDVLVRVDAGPGADDAETAELAQQLRTELVAHDLDPVVPDSTAPAGAKGVGLDIGALLVTLAASGGVLTTLLGVLQSWLLRHSGSRIVIEIDGDRVELTGATDEERRRALESWLTRYDAGGTGKAPGGDPTAA